MKKTIKQNLRLYAITDRSWLGGAKLEEQVEQAILGGATIIQFREKSLQGEELKQQAIRVQAVCRKYNIPFLVNDLVELAAEIDADGVHVGQSDMSVQEARMLLGEEKIIGATAKTVEQALRAQSEGADYLGSGAIFGSSTKTDAVPMTRERLQEICHSVQIPVVAIGGISEENVSWLQGLDIAGVAVISAIFAKKDIRKATELLAKKVAWIAERNSVAENAEKSGTAEITEKMEDDSRRKRKAVLTIAGSDCSGGAGIQADLKTMLANGVYGMSAITALTAQNTLGVKSILEVTPVFLQEQLDAIFCDIAPDAVKVGMIANAELIHVIAEKLRQYQTQNIVVDPVMVSTSGSKLLQDDAVTVLESELLPLACLITPNIPEAECLLGKKITDQTQMEAAGRELSEKYGCAVLIKGGHAIAEANDLLCGNGQMHWFHGKRIDNPNTHGTGCTLSSAIASNLAKGEALVESIEHAKEYLTGALEQMLDLGQGSGPVDHGYVLDTMKYLK